MKKIFGLIAALAIATTAQATTPVLKDIDQISATGGSVLSVPSVGSNLVSDTSTVNLTNKTISGSSNTLTNISTASLAAGFTLSVGNGGTGATSFTSNGILYGNSTSALQVTAAGSQYQTLQAGSGGVPAFDAVHLDQAAAITGTLGVSNGGTGQSILTAHDVLVGNGTSGITQVSPTSNSGWVLTSNGTGSDPSFQAPSSTAPTISGTAATPLSITATGISLTAPTYSNVAFIKGSASGNTTVTGTPSITACTAAGQVLVLVSEDATHTITLQNNADLAGSQLLLNGPWTSGENNSTPYTIKLVCDGAATPNWVEEARNN